MLPFNSQTNLSKGALKTYTPKSPSTCTKPRPPVLLKATKRRNPTRKGPNFETLQNRENPQYWLAKHRTKLQTAALSGADSSLEGRQQLAHASKLHPLCSWRFGGSIHGHRFLPPEYTGGSCPLPQRIFEVFAAKLAHAGSLRQKGPWAPNGGTPRMGPLFPLCFPFQRTQKLGYPPNIIYLFIYMYMYICIYICYAPPPSPPDYSGYSMQILIKQNLSSIKAFLLKQLESHAP